MNRPPNILIFNPDQWRGDTLGHMGHPAVATPNIDRLVRDEAVSFRSAFCQNPVCTPSRCSFMTGWYPHVRGHRTMFHMLRPDEPCLLRRLKDSGYHVWWSGKNDLVPAQDGYAAYCDERFIPTDADFARWGHRPAPDTHGADGWRGKPGSDTYYSFFAGRLIPPDGDSIYCNHDWASILGAIDFIRRAPKDRPVCIYLPLGYPHPPYGVEEPWYGMADRRRLPPRIPAPPTWDGKPSLLRGVHERQAMQGWTEERWTELRATYCGMCSRVDHQFGLVLDALREAGLYDSTAAFLFSDHGDFTGDYGLVEKTQNTFEDCLSRVPFVVKPPRDVAVKPRVSDALVELVDFPATVYALTGIEPGYTHFGRSLLPVLAGATDEHRDAVFCEGGRLDGERHAMELESEAHTVPTGLYWPRVGLQSRIPEHSKAVMCRTRRFKYVRRLYETDEFYDLASDPGETQNRIADSALSGEVARLKDRLLTHLLETGDVVPHQTDRRV